MKELHQFDITRNMCSLYLQHNMILNHRAWYLVRSIKIIVILVGR